MKVNLYKSGNPGVEDRISQIEMKPAVAGTWTAEVPGDQNGVYYTYTVELEDLALSFDVKGKAELDITEELREEVLLELPGYPKCEISGLECKINDTIGDFRLDKDPQTGVECPAPSGQSVWDALDQFPSK